MSIQDYKPMEKAPLDGTVVLVLTGSRKPRAAYYDAKEQVWKLWHNEKEVIHPDYWTDVPAEPPSDYLADLRDEERSDKAEKALEHGALMDALDKEGKERSKPPAEGQFGKQVKPGELPPNTPEQNEALRRMNEIREQEAAQQNEYLNPAYFAQRAQEGKPPFVPKEQAPIAPPLVTTPKKGTPETKPFRPETMEKMPAPAPARAAEKPKVQEKPTHKATAFKKK